MGVAAGLETHLPARGTGTSRQPFTLQSQIITAEDCHSSSHLLKGEAILYPTWLRFRFLASASIVFAALLLPLALDTFCLLVQWFLFSSTDASKDVISQVWDATSSISLGVYACTIAWLVLQPSERFPTVLLAIACWLLGALNFRIVFQIDQLIGNIYIGHMPGVVDFRDVFATVLIGAMFVRPIRIRTTSAWSGGRRSQIFDIFTMTFFGSLWAFQFSIYEFNKGLFLQESLSACLAGLFAWIAALAYTRLENPTCRILIFTAACCTQAVIYFAIVKLIYRHYEYDYDLVRTHPVIFASGLLVAAMFAFPMLQFLQAKIESD